MIMTEKEYCVYIMTNAGRTVLYTGVTKQSATPGFRA
jgi:predicted GIY-YIG superfamily endonuclease